MGIQNKELGYGLPLCRLAACEMEVRWRFGSGAAQVWWRSDLGVATGACLRLVGDLRCCD
jgi:hypothetical protein